MFVNKTFAYTYDTIGNRTSYDGYTYVWEAGRQLKRMTKDGSTIDYKYDDSGIRQSKTVNGVTTNFTTIGGKITSQNDGTDSLYFRYDKDDSLVGVQVNGAEYLYIRNLQGDIISIIDYDGNIVVNYTYDSFGKVISVTGSLADTIGQLNPMRYRGYYYDSETGFYYLQSRYYDADMQRFINADDTSVLGASGTIIGCNLFAYCENNPVNMYDPDGHLPQWLNDFCRGFKDGFGGAAAGLLNSFLHPLQSLKSIFSLRNLLSGVISNFTLGGQVLWQIFKSNFYNAGKLYGAHIFKGLVVLITMAAGTAAIKLVGAIKQTAVVQNLINSVSKLKFSKTINTPYYLNSRPYMTSGTNSIIKEIMKAAKPVKYASTKINGYKWTVPGTWWQKGWASAKTGTWELVIDANTNTIVHFLFNAN